MNKLKPTTRSGRLFHDIYFKNPILSTLASSVTGGLLGRYVGAPIANLFLPGGLGYEETERRKKRMRNILTILGAAPGIITGVGRQFNKKSSVVPVSASRELVLNDPYLTPGDKNQILAYLDEASGGKDRGIITPTRLIRTGMGAGMGYGAANAASNVFGAIFGLKPATRSKFSRLGLIAGALYGSGVIKDE